LYDAFVKGFGARAAKIKIGDEFNPETGMGPLINRGHLDTKVAQIVF